MKMMYQTLLTLSVLSATCVASAAQAGDYCREYTQKIYVGGRAQDGYSTACLQPDGAWQTGRTNRYDDEPDITAAAYPTKDYYYDKNSLIYGYTPRPVEYPVVVEQHVTVVNPRPVYVRPNIYSLTRDILGYDDVYYNNNYRGRGRGHHGHNVRASFYDDHDDAPRSWRGRDDDRPHRRVYVD